MPDLVVRDVLSGSQRSLHQPQKRGKEGHELASFFSKNFCSNMTAGHHATHVQVATFSFMADTLYQMQFIELANLVIFGISDLHLASFHFYHHLVYNYNLGNYLKVKKASPKDDWSNLSSSSLYSVKQKVIDVLVASNLKSGLKSKKS